MKPLRAYQVDCADAIDREWQEVVSTLAVLPTGSGKTRVAAEIIRRHQPARALFICQARELVYQARQSITDNTGLECGIEMADLYVNESMFGNLPVVIATVQTLNSAWGDRTRMSRFKPNDFGVLIVDEFHHSVAPSYKNVINYFTQNKNLRVLGLTATPDRLDEEALGQICQSVACDYEILDAIHDGWLLDVDQQFATIGTLNFSHIRTTCGELNQSDLAAVMEAEENIQGIVQPTLEAMFGLPVQALKDITPDKWWDLLSQQPHIKRCIVFTVTVVQAEALCNIFNRIKPDLFAWVCGKTNKDKRKEILSQFADGEIKGVCNVGVLTEGFDDPGVEMIAMARPTKSRALYSQCCGRAMRPLPGIVDGLDNAEQRLAAIAASDKKSMLVLDFVGNSGKHKLMTSADILGGKISEEALELALKKIRKDGSAIRMTDALDEAEEQARKLAEDRRRHEEARKARLVARTAYVSRQINPFDVFALAPVRERGWDSGKVLSEKQRDLLRKHLGVDPDSIPYAQGKQLLNEQFRRWKENLCSLRQAKVLKRAGYDPKNIGRSEASKLIDALAKNGWKRPQHEPELVEEGVPF